MPINTEVAGFEETNCREMEGHTRALRAMAEQSRFRAGLNLLLELELELTGATKDDDDTRTRTVKADGREMPVRILVGGTFGGRCGPSFSLSLVLPAGAANLVAVTLSQQLGAGMVRVQGNT